MSELRGDVYVAAKEGGGFQVYDVSEGEGSSACWGDFAQISEAVESAQTTAATLNARFDLAAARRSGFSLIEGGKA